MGPRPGGMQAPADGPVELGQRGCQLALHLTSSEKPSLLPLKGTQASFKRDCPTGRLRHLQQRSLGIERDLSQGTPQSLSQALGGWLPPPLRC